jgi:hypothetical protein
MNAMHDPNDLDLGDVEDDYEIRQRARDEDYRKAYTEWIASLPAEDLERLGELGLDRPSVPGSGTGAPSRDMAESSMACCGPEEPSGALFSAAEGQEADPATRPSASILSASTTSSAGSSESSSARTTPASPSSASPW